MAGRKLLSTLKFIVNHPMNEDHKIGALMRFCEWQIKSRVIGGSLVHKWVGNSKFLVRASETGLTQNIYTGLQDFNDMAFLLHLLREDDLFVDVGANAGSYTILACAVRGARAYSFEPVPDTYRRLSANIKLNRVEDRAKHLNIGIGGGRGFIKFTSKLDTTNHALAPGERTDNSLSIEVVPLDEVLADESPILMKIDVEGYEAEVIKGAKETLNKPSLRAVIIELNGSGTRYGWNDASVSDFLRGFGFEPYLYSPFQRMLEPLAAKNSHSNNTLFIRDAAFVRDRLKAAPLITVHHRSF
jgi:FkbM family methyltransferase